MKAFIDSNFRLCDVNNDGVIGVEEFRYNAIQRLATDEIKIVDDAFNSLLNVSKNPSHRGFYLPAVMNLS